jgi:hypothetical protein
MPEQQKRKVLPDYRKYGKGCFLGQHLHSFSLGFVGKDGTKLCSGEPAYYFDWLNMNRYYVCQNHVHWCGIENKHVIKHSTYYYDLKKIGE